MGELSVLELTWADQFSFPSDGHVRSLLCWHLAHVFSSFTWHVALALCQYHSALYTLRSFSDVCCNFFVIDIFFSLFIHLDAPFDMCNDIFVAILFSPLACVVFFHISIQSGRSFTFLRHTHTTTPIWTLYMCLLSVGGRKSIWIQFPLECFSFVNLEHTISYSRTLTIWTPLAIVSRERSRPCMCIPSRKKSSTSFKSTGYLDSWTADCRNFPFPVTHTLFCKESRRAHQHSSTWHLCEGVWVCAGYVLHKKGRIHPPTHKQSQSSYTSTTVFRE